MKYLIYFCVVTLGAALLCNANAPAALVQTSAIAIVSDSDGVSSSSNGESSVSNQRRPTKTNPFIPTNEWQVVEEGQSIPAGLHVEMNFQTHVRRAKLMVETDGIQTVSEQREEKKRAKLDIMRPYIEATAGASAYGGTPLLDLSKEVENQFSSPSNQASASDVGIMQTSLIALTQYTADDNDVALSTAFEALEDVLGDLDNAKEFLKLGGIQALCTIVQQNASLNTQAHAVKLLGLASQNNIDIQKAVGQILSMGNLLSLLTTAGSVRDHMRVLFGIAALCRNNMDARDMFLAYRGSNALAAVSVINAKLFMKSMTLVTDLIIDEATIAPLDESIPLIDTVMDRAVDLAALSGLAANTSMLKAAVAAGWCSLIPTKLGQGNDDVNEKTLEAMLVTMHACHTEFNAFEGTLRDLASASNTVEEDEDTRIFQESLQSLARESLLLLVKCRDSFCSV